METNTVFRLTSSCQPPNVSLVRTVAAVHGNHLMDGLFALDCCATEVFECILRGETSDKRDANKRDPEGCVSAPSIQFERPPAGSVPGSMGVVFFFFFFDE